MSVDHYVVMGNPVEHSQSPFIHHAFAEQTRQAVHYDRLRVETAEGAFESAVKDFQQQGGHGLNVTVPFKQTAWALAAQRQPRAERAGAVNTLWFDADGQWIGDNTDGVGLVRDLTQNYGADLHGQRILILGAGGAVRGVLEPLLATRPDCCVIANRTVEKAETLAELFSTLGNVRAMTYEAIAGQSFDLIINGTSASLQGDLPPLPPKILATGGWCYDMMYAPRATPFVHWAMEQGAVYALDGLGMLVEQAAEAFFLWRGVRPETWPVICALRNNLNTLYNLKTGENSGRQQGLEPTRYGDWEKAGRCIDF